MLILLTNDDGLSAPGIRALAEVLSEIAELYIAAPDRERSGTGHGITVFSPIMTRKVGMKDITENAWVVDGTPVDCVKLAVTRLVPAKPDLVLSGINNGPNLGTDVLYSGTVSAAVEGVIMGVPSVAVSLNTHNPNADYSFAAHFTRSIIEKLQQDGIEKDTILNINVPAVSRQEIRGMRVTRLGVRRYENEFEERMDPRGNKYYWLGGNVVEQPQTSDSDVWAVSENYVSITPIHFDLTDYKLIDKYRARYQENIDACLDVPNR